MPKPARVKASTQHFIEVVDIIDNVVLLEGGYACAVINVTASNFALLSKKEQDAKIYAYASLLNSLNFPIQIVIRNQLVDITSYLNSLEEQERLTKNPLLITHIQQYRNFVHQMIKVNIVLNKEFYIVITYSSLEEGAGGATQTFKKGDLQKLAFAENAKKSLSSKSESLLTQLRRLALAARVLNKEELVKLYYTIYNQDNMETTEVAENLTSAMVRVQER